MTGRDEASRDERTRFSLAGVRDGYLAGFPVAVGVAGYGVAFGVLAHSAGLTVLEATLMSATVLAGAAQLVAVELWASSPTVPVVERRLRPAEQRLERDEVVAGRQQTETDRRYRGHPR